MPADRDTNQPSKRDRVPREGLAIWARDRMLEWWHIADAGPTPL